MTNDTDNNELSNFRDDLSPLQDDRIFRKKQRNEIR